MNQLLYSIVYMRYSQLIDEVLTVYTGLDQHLTSVAKQNGLSCPQFCSRCCLKPDIEASPIEFLPLAAYLYKTNQVDEFLAKLDGNEDGICVNYNADASQRGEWGCQNYLYRGLICRLFGYGFRLNREGIPGLVTCKIMKENLSVRATERMVARYKSTSTFTLKEKFISKKYNSQVQLTKKSITLTFSSENELKLFLEKLEK